jgi:anaerobic ribonucleoside-triphosphate reductase activating protein
MKGKYMNYCEIKECDIANGDGVRTSLFVSGCDKKCKGCFNPDTWDPNAGKLFDNGACGVLLTSLKKPWCRGLTLLGGDPFFPGNRASISELLKKVRSEIKEFSEHKKDIWMYTGYLFEDLLKYEQEENRKFSCQVVNDKVVTSSRPILRYLDVLLDGPFIEEQKDLSLKFRGSANQRIIDVQKSLKEDKVVIYY